jgi:hypothetical protein
VTIRSLISGCQAPDQIYIRLQGKHTERNLSSPSNFALAAGLSTPRAQQKLCADMHTRDQDKAIRCTHRHFSPIAIRSGVL